MAVARIACTLVTIVLTVTTLSAQAQTYIATFRSGKLKPVPNSSVPGISGITHLTLSLYSKKPFPSNFNGSWTNGYGFSDGAETLKSLKAEGYSVQIGYPYVGYSTDGAGNIVSWYIRTNMPNSNVQSGINYYSFSVDSNWQGGGSQAQVVFQNGQTGETYALDNGLPTAAYFSMKP